MFLGKNPRYAPYLLAGRPARLHRNSGQTVVAAGTDCAQITVQITFTRFQQKAVIISEWLE